MRCAPSVHSIGEVESGCRRQHKTSHTRGTASVADMHEAWRKSSIHVCTHLFSLLLLLELLLHFQPLHSSGSTSQDHWCQQANVHGSIIRHSSSVGKRVHEWLKWQYKFAIKHPKNVHAGSSAHTSSCACRCS